jgi:nucleotide-binding universal stress UspA family protein
MNEAPTGPVLVGYDGTDRGADALALGVVCARVLEAGLIVAAVYPEPAPIGPARVDAEWVADRQAAAEQALDQARSTLAGWGQTPPSTSFVAVGSSSAAHGLHDLAESWDAQLIVVGPHPEWPARRLVAGSTADRLLAGVPCPVAIAPHGLRLREIRDPRVIGVGYIDTPDGRAALAAAARLAGRTGASLRLYTVLPKPAEVMPLLLGRDAEQAFTETAREAYQRAIDAAIAELRSTCQATGQVISGNVVEVLAGLEDDVDLLFCGSRGYGPVRRVLLGGVSARLVGRARTPVVIVPRGGTPP